MNKRTVLKIFGLLLLMYSGSLCIFLVSEDSYYFDNALLLSFMRFALVCIIMMTAPTFSRLINGKRIEPARGKKICLWNSIILTSISALMITETSVGFIGTMGGMAFYYINKWIFVDIIEEQRLKNEPPGVWHFAEGERKNPTVKDSSKQVYVYAENKASVPAKPLYESGNASEAIVFTQAEKEILYNLKKEQEKGPVKRKLTGEEMVAIGKYKLLKERNHK